LDVEEDEVGRERTNRLDRLNSVRRLANDFDIALVREEAADALPRDLLVVDDQHAERHASAGRATTTLLVGRRAARE
jgi:hypothetical protein